MNQLLKRTLKYNNLKLISRSISIVDPPKYDKSNNSKIFYGVLGAGALTCLGLYKFSGEKRKVYAASTASIAGSFRKDLPNYTLDQVSLHSSKIFIRAEVVKFDEYFTDFEISDKMLPVPLWVDQNDHIVEHKMKQ